MKRKKRFDEHAGFIASVLVATLSLRRIVTIVAVPMLRLGYGHAF
jgi:hypothetical protein